MSFFSTSTTLDPDRQAILASLGRTRGGVCEFAILT
jgi:hypothetical protein